MALVVKASIEQKTIAGLTRTWSKLDISTMVASRLPPDSVDEEDVAMWASFTQTSDATHGEDTLSIQIESGNKTGNETEKCHIFHKFVQTLSRHAALHLLVQLVDDETTKGKTL
jgi:hypothetical protein